MNNPNLEARLAALEEKVAKLESLSHPPVKIEIGDIMDRLAKLESSPSQPKPKRTHPGAGVVLEWLNLHTKRSFRPTERNLELISQRLYEPGVTTLGVQIMIVRQCKRWLGTDQAEYLRPETLFNRTKFDAYYAAKDMPIAQSASGGQPDRNAGHYSRDPDGGNKAERVLAQRNAQKETKQ